MMASSILDAEKAPDIDVDVVSQEVSNSTPVLDSSLSSLLKQLTHFLSCWGIETNGIDPIPPMLRSDPRLYQMFFVWFSVNFNILGFGTATAGSAFFGIGLRTSLAVLLIVDLITCAVPAYFAVFGPKLGMRSMVQARYSWGYYLSAVPSALNVISMQGFLVISCIIGGQTLASVSDHLSDTLGIVIISVISLAVTFFGYRVIHWYESLAWIPSVVTFIVMLGVGGKHLTTAPAPEPVSPATVVTFATTIASSVVSWCTMTPDYGVYHSAEASSTKIFLYSYAGFFLSSITAHMLGAAFAASAPLYAPWEAGFAGGSNVGGLLAAVLAPAGRFGKFLTVLVALTIPSACAPTMYTFASSAMAVSPYFARVPRYVYALISTAILIPVAIVGAAHFYSTMTDVLNLIGYWSTVFAAVVLVEHVLFRRCSFAQYDAAAWDRPRRLPLGVAALLAFLCAFALVIPCMDQAWYVGPIARTGLGDIGIVMGFALVCVLYPVFRIVERVWWKA
ncbi:purine-cytosine permease [Amylocystis lapponica]|nr:purine-cytosine permease [Amylocystis lapponica]